MAPPPRPRVFLDVTIGAEPAGRLTLELFTDQTPKTCENFRRLCANSPDSDLTYVKSPFHRVIDEFMIQGGDITSGDGTGGKSIYNDGAEFEDENLGWRDMDAAGLVCMANRGKDTNSSQFFITLEPCDHLNGKHTIFGHLVSGQEVLDRIAQVPVTDSDTPKTPVLIARCGELERKRKPAEQSVRVSRESRSNDRGRRPSEIEKSLAERSPQRLMEKRKRRQSDNLIDETLRGRPRARSDDEGVEDAIEEDDESDMASNPVVHDRKRSVSPSRKPGRNMKRGDREESSESERRRRSLPNQYGHDSRDRRRDSERRDRDGGARRDDRRGPPPGRDWDDPRGAERRDDRRDDRRDYRAQGRRQQDSYRPGRGHRDGRSSNDGRLGGDGRLGAASGDGGDGEGAIKFKGRGSMKFREPDRRW